MPDTPGTLPHLPCVCSNLLQFQAEGSTTAKIEAEYADTAANTAADTTLFSQLCDEFW